MIRWLLFIFFVAGFQSFSVADPAFPYRLQDSVDKRRVIGVWLWGDTPEADASSAQKKQVLLDLVTDMQIQREFFHRVIGAGINRIYLNVNLSADGEFLFSDHSAQLANFIRRARLSRIEVFALFGDGAYVPRSAHHLVVGERGLLEAILVFNSLQQYGFDGIQSDIEPYYDPATGKPTDLQQVGGVYLELTAAMWRRIQAYREASGVPFVFEVALPFWYGFPTDEGLPPTQVTFEGRLATMDMHVLELVDAVAVMAYRDQADGPNGVIALAKPTVDLAGKLGKKVLVALETQKPNPRYGVTPHITLFEEGVTGLRRVMAKVDAHFSPVESYQGIAIHHYDSLIHMGPGRQIDESLLARGVLWTESAGTGVRLWDVSGNYGHYGNPQRDNSVTSAERDGQLQIDVRATGGWGAGVSILFARTEDRVFLDASGISGLSVTWCSEVHASMQLADARWHDLDDSIPIGLLPATGMQVRRTVLPIGRPHPVWGTVAGDDPKFVYSGSDEYGWIDRTRLASLFLRFSPPQQGRFRLLDLRFVSNGVSEPDTSAVTQRGCSGAENGNG